MIDSEGNCGAQGSEGSIFKFKPAKLELKFHKVNGNVIGKLVEDDNGRLSFTGDAEGSAQVMLNSVCALNNSKILNLTGQVAELKTDRDNAISKMSKSWQHNADDYADLLSKFVDMANRQFDERDKLTKENAELRAMLQKTVTAIYSHNNEMVGIHTVINCASEALELLNKTEQ